MERCMQITGARTRCTDKYTIWKCVANGTRHSRFVEKLTSYDASNLKCTLTRFGHAPTGPHKGGMSSSWACILHWAGVAAVEGAA